MPDTRTLLIDDDPFALKLLTHQLAQIGMVVIETATSGQHALEILIRKQADTGDLIFLDLNMPEMDGVEFMRHLAALRFPGHLVLVSGEDQRILETATSLARTHRLNVLGHLQKPVQPAALRTLLDSRGASSSRRDGKRKKVFEPEEVRLAIARRELVNFYQPKVNLASGALNGVETLVRWRHPVDGLIFPDQFIGVAEEHGLMDDLTRTVLCEALEQTRRWLNAGLTHKVAVNISMDNLKRLDFADFVIAEIKRHDIPAQHLILEITESRLMQDVLSSLDVLARLRMKKISLSIDDFGTGHSSLTQLRDLPFDELKIDRSFVHAASADRTRHAILSASLDMTRKLGMRSVAEGVEDLADWNFLRTLNCDLVQGYFIAKPMPADDLPAWLAEWETRRPALLI